MNDRDLLEIMSRSRGGDPLVEYLLKNQIERDEADKKKAAENKKLLESWPTFTFSQTLTAVLAFSVPVAYGVVKLYVWMYHSAMAALSTIH